MTSTQHQDEYKIYSEMIEDEIFYKKRWFIDYRLFKAIVPGYIIKHHLTDDVSYQKYLKILESDIYQNRISDLPEVIFKDLNIPKVTLDEIYNNLTYKDLALIPNTNFILLFNELLKFNNTNATVVQEHPAELYINLYPFKLPKETIFHLEEFLSQVFQNCKVSTLYIPYSKITSIIYNYDVYVLYDIEELLQTKYFESIDNEAKLKQLLDLTFITQRLTNKAELFDTKTTKELKADFEFTENYLNVISNFQYIPPTNILK